jgi:8-oxo-dGTP diphosphatase
LITVIRGFPSVAITVIVTVTITIEGYNVKMTRTTRHPAFAVAVDLVILTVRDGVLQALLIERGEEPFEGQFALPGGFVRPDEDLEEAATRELEEETGILVTHLEQLASYGDPNRDPRMRVVSVAYLALAPELPSPTAGTDAAAADWHPVSGLTRRRLAFDHRSILRDGVERARAKLEYTTLATAFCPPEFTISDLREVYEAIWGELLDPRNFSRKVLSTQGFVRATSRTTSGSSGRPAQLYRPGDAVQLSPPLQRAAG